MERNIMGEPGMCRQAGTKPNFAALARKYGMDRHTVAKCWRGGGRVEDHRSDRPSGFDQVREVIEEKAKLPGVTKKGIHEYLLDRHADKDLPGHDDLVHYMNRRGMACGLPDEGPEPHPRHGTAPGAPGASPGRPASRYGCAAPGRPRPRARTSRPTDSSPGSWPTRATSTARRT